MAQETGTRDIEQDLALCEKATPGPWQARQIVGVAGPMQMPAANGWELLGMTEDGMPLADWFERKEDAVFTVEAREALPYWLGEVKRLQKALDLACEEIADAHCPAGILDAAEFSTWDECVECPAQEGELYADSERDTACWKRYYLEKAGVADG